MSTLDSSFPTPDVGVQFHSVAIFSSEMRQLPGHCDGLPWPGRIDLWPNSLLVFFNGKHTHSFWEIHSLRQPKSILLAWSSIWLIIVQKHPLKLQVSEETPFLDGSKKFHIKKTRSLVGGDVTPEKTNGSK